MAFKDFALYDPKKMYEYAAGDADATRRLFFIFLNKLKKEGGLLDYFKSPVMPLSKNLIFSSLHGVRVDFKKVKELTELITKSRDYYLDKMVIFLANPNFSPRSVPALRKVLFTDLKLDHLIETKKGAPSTSSEAIEEVRKLNSKNKKGLEFIDLLVLYRKLDKLLATYLSKISGFCDENGYVHPRFIVGATVSGRVSVKDPPLTTLPKDTKYDTPGGKVLVSIRSIYIPSNDSVWVHADYSQIELVVSAFLSKDPLMVSNFRERRDIHEETMKIANGEDYISEEAAITDSLKSERSIQRRDAKIINFSIIYLAKPYNTARILGYPVEKIEYMMNKMFEKYHVLHKYLINIPSVVARNGFLKSPFGRIRHFPKGPSLDSGAQGHQDRQAVNWGPQSCGAEITFRALNRIAERFRKLGMRSKPHGLVYDAIEFDILKIELEDAKKIIVQEMSRPVPQFEDFSFAFELGIGENMSDAEKNCVKYMDCFDPVFD